MEEREVWIQAGAIFAAHGDGGSDYVIDRMIDALGDRTAVSDWQRVAAALEAVTSAELQ